jgi:hypothetical protein
MELSADVTPGEVTHVTNVPGQLPIEQVLAPAAETNMHNARAWRSLEIHSAFWVSHIVDT